VLRNVTTAFFQFARFIPGTRSTTIQTS